MSADPSKRSHSLGPFRHLAAPQDKLPILRPVRSAEDAHALELAAAHDNHLCLAPNYIIEKGGEIVGYTSLNAIPYCHGWLHTTKMQARDSLIVFNHMENLGRLQGWKSIGWRVPVTGTFAPLLERMGYTLVDTAKFGVKGLS